MERNNAFRSLIPSLSGINYKNRTQKSTPEQSEVHTTDSLRTMGEVNKLIVRTCPTVTLW